MGACSYHHPTWSESPGWARSRPRTVGSWLLAAPVGLALVALPAALPAAGPAIDAARTPAFVGLDRALAGPGELGG
ncbi:MAG TPA: hypothetical protein VMD59_01860, partial [Acidimicrobiales bacterium]|nr:hypothetical protein [Acidimicrobiales bacterium]